MSDWGVLVDVYYADADTDQIDDIEVSVHELIPHDASEFEGVRVTPSYYVPFECFRPLPDITYGDTHDLRTRRFETEQEARDHAEAVERRWRHPAPWESFVCV